MLRLTASASSFFNTGVGGLDIGGVEDEAGDSTSQQFQSPKPAYKPKNAKASLSGLLSPKTPKSPTALAYTQDEVRSPGKQAPVNPEGIKMTLGRTVEVVMWPGPEKLKNYAAKKIQSGWHGKKIRAVFNEKLAQALAEKQESAAASAAAGEPDDDEPFSTEPSYTERRMSSSI